MTLIHGEKQIAVSLDSSNGCKPVSLHNPSLPKGVTAGIPLYMRPVTAAWWLDWRFGV